MADTVRVDCAVPPEERITDAVVKDRLGPDGETVAVRLRVPENPSRLERVMVDAEVEFCVTLSDDGLVAI
jgi:hypothetical protein